MPGELTEKQKALLAKLRGGQMRISPVDAAIPRLNATHALPVSRAQRRIVFEERLYPGNVFNGTLALDHRGPLDTAALQRALDTVVERHAILRSNASLDGATVSARYNAPGPIPFQVVDLRHLDGASASDRVLDLGRAEAGRRIDIFRDPVLIRAMLFAFSDSEHVLLLTMHMYAFDAPSGSLLVEDLARCYGAIADGREPPPLSPDHQYADYLAWEATKPAKDPKASLDYWRAQLGGRSPALQLPVDRERKASPEFTAARFPFKIDRALADTLKTHAKAGGVSFYLLLLSALKCLLARHTHQSSISVGAWMVQRNSHTLKLIGPFVNTVVYRTEIAPDDRFVDVLGKVRTVANGVYAHGQAAFEDVVGVSGAARDSRINPLFQVHFILQEVGSGEELAGFSLSPFDGLIGAAGGYDVELVIRDLKRGVEGHFECNSELFTAVESERLRGRFLAILRAVGADPQIPVGAIILEPNSPVPVTDLDAAPRHDQPPDWRFDGERPAVVLRGGAVMTRGDLDRRIAVTEARLASLAAGSRVAIVTERPVVALIGLLACLRRGLAFAILPPGTHERLGSPIDGQTFAAAIVTSAATIAPGTPRLHLDMDMDELDAPASPGRAAPPAPPAPRASPEAAAYFTCSSGTGGPARLAPVSAAAFQIYLNSIGPALGIDDATVSLQLARPSFDVFLEETLPTLIAGGRVIEGRPEDQGRLHHLGADIEAHGATHVNLPATLWMAWARLLMQSEAALPPSLKVVVIGSEPVDIALVRAWQARFGRRVRLINAYGASECAVTSLVYEVPSVDVLDNLPRLPVGRPLNGQWAEVRDVEGRRLPDGAVGRISLGLAGRDAGGCDTGDLGRRRADGDIEWLARSDGRAKHLGGWIDLARLEAAARADPHVDCCQCRLTEGPRPELHVEVTPAPGAEAWFTQEQADGWPQLRGLLAEAGQPGVYPAIVRWAGPPPRAPAPTADAVVDPRLREIADLWRRVVGRDLPVSQNLFELGVTSMDFMMFCALAEAEGMPLALAALYDLQTIEAQAAHLRRELATRTPIAAK